jgi:hypothetical protein
VRKSQRGRFADSRGGSGNEQILFRKFSLHKFFHSAFLIKEAAPFVCPSITHTV